MSGSRMRMIFSSRCSISLLMARQKAEGFGFRRISSCEKRVLLRRSCSFRIFFASRFTLLTSSSISGVFSLQHAFFDSRRLRFARTLLSLAVKKE